MREAAVKRIAAFCDARSPAEAQDDHRIEYGVRGTTITIVEQRAPWRPGAGSEWSTTKVAQLRYDEPTLLWTLYAAGSDDRWHVYEFAPPAEDVAPLLDVIEQDRTGIFWG